MWRACVHVQASTHTFCKIVLNLSLSVLKCGECPNLTEAHSNTAHCRISDPPTATWWPTQNSTPSQQVPGISREYYTLSQPRKRSKPKIQGEVSTHTYCCHTTRKSEVICQVVTGQELPVHLLKYARTPDLGGHC